MLATRLTGLRSGLLMLLVLAGSGSPAAGRAEEGALSAPLLLPPPEVLVESGRTVDLASQILWSDPERIHVLGLIPQSLLAIEPRTGLVEHLTAEGPGPFEIGGPMVLLSAGDAPDQILVHEPGRLRSIVFSRASPPRQLKHELPMTGCAGEWWLNPMLWDPGSDAPGQVRVSSANAVVWTGEHTGSVAEVLTAQYFTRLLPGPDRRLWRVVLGMGGRADLIDPASGASRVLDVDPAEGAWIDATVDREGTLHLLTAGGSGSHGRRVLRFDPRPLPPLHGDRNWNTGAVDPTGTRWVAMDAEDASVLLYDITS